MSSTLDQATPRRGTVRDRWGDPCPGADRESYPLRAECENCRADITCSDGTADWRHKGTRFKRCD